MLTGIMRVNRIHTVILGILSMTTRFVELSVSPGINIKHAWQQKDMIIVRVTRKGIFNYLP